jgi:hydrogenase 3 maturation protease
MSGAAQLRKRLDTLRGSNVVILCLGSTLRGDDAVGPQVYSRLAGQVSATVIDAGTVPENHIQPVLRAEPDTLLIVDAVNFGAPAGSLRAFDPQDVDAFAFSTHALSPRLFVDMVRMEREVSVLMIGIQPVNTDMGVPVSPAVKKSIDILASLLVDTFPAT